MWEDHRYIYPFFVIHFLCSCRLLLLPYNGKSSYASNVSVGNHWQRCSSSQIVFMDQIPLSDFKAGQIFDGEVSAGLLYHGARVDIGGEYDG